MAFFFFNDTATTEIYTLSLHDALPISWPMLPALCFSTSAIAAGRRRCCKPRKLMSALRSEEHTSELQSHLNLVCRLLLEKKKNLQLSRLAKLNTVWRMPPVMIQEDLLD